jgi:crotonobetainyl-CoA:carnitine CoA-transferase CaiB-like acyl-CoA transferase
LDDLSRNAPNARAPLDGLRVVDMTEALAGPFCGMLLGDLGADVIKVERPGVGDQSRGWGPPFLDGESAYFLSVNRNKRSIELDIKEPDDAAVLKRLLNRADVFITNNPRMSSLERNGLDPRSLTTLNPGLVYVAISGYGHSGPKAGRGGYDIIAQGEAGLMALTGEPEGGPTRFPSPMADISGGVYATIAALSALYARDSRSGDGGGQFIDLSLVEAQATWLANLAGSYFATGQRPQRLGNAHPTVTPYQPVRARDKMMIIAVGNERLWQRFCRVLGIEATIMADTRFATNAQRNLNRPALVAELEAILVERDADEWIKAFVAEGIPAGPINFPDDTLNDAHVRDRGLIVELEHPRLGSVRSLALPFHFMTGGPTYRRPPPLLGEHSAEIRAEVGAAAD